METQLPRVSVVTIFLNAERFLEEAIESVLAQTHPSWELLLVDDGSTDASTAIARQYVDRHRHHIRYFEHTAHANRGMSASRNLGIAHARGEFIAFLDADDTYRPEKLERQTSLLDAHADAGMIFGATEYWYSWTGRVEDQGRDRVRRRGLPSGVLIPPPRLIPLFVSNEAQPPTTCGVLLRRSAVEHVGGFEESFRGMFEDQVFFYKICTHVPVYVDDGCWDRYRQHDDSWTHEARRRGDWAPEIGVSPSHAQFMEWLADYLARSGITDERVFRILRRELWPYRHPRLHRLIGTGWRSRLRQRVRRLLG
jgi:glycosyltransferase involved in cell wall biosynthesis